MSVNWMSIDPTSVIAAVSAIGVALVSGTLTILGGRRKARADIQGTLNSGFQILITELQEERVQLVQSIKEAQARIWSLEEELKKQERQILELEELVNRSGIALPTRYFAAPKS